MSPTLTKRRNQTMPKGWPLGNSPGCDPKSTPQGQPQCTVGPGVATLKLHPGVATKAAIPRLEIATLNLQPKARLLGPYPRGACLRSEKISTSRDLY